MTSLISLEQLLPPTSALPQYKKPLTQSCSLFLDAQSPELGLLLMIASSLPPFNKPSPTPRSSLSHLNSPLPQITLSLAPISALTLLLLIPQFLDKEHPTEEPMDKSLTKIPFGSKTLEFLALSLDFGKPKIFATSSKEIPRPSPT